MDLSASQAVQIAKSWVIDLLGEPPAFRVEEVEWEDERWYVTLGWYDPEGSPDYREVRQHPLDALAFQFRPSVKPTGRVYKRIEIDDESGEVQGMTMREL